MPHSAIKGKCINTIDIKENGIKKLLGKPKPDLFMFQ